MNDERSALPLLGRSRYSKAAFLAIAERAAEVLRPLVSRGPEGAVEAARVAAERSEAWVAAAAEEEPPTMPIACRKGCSTCCTAKVLVFAPEVMRIAEHLRATLSEEAIAALIEQVKETESRTRGLSRAARAEARVPCPLLDAEGGCRVHAVRPLVCRSWTSYDASACDVYFRAPSGALTPPQWALGYELVQAVLAGLGKACFDAGRDGTPLELVAALRIALERPAAGERWHRRLPVFSAARDAEWVEKNARPG